MIICRVCLDNNDTLIPLISDNDDARPLVYMLNGFTIINAEKQLPKYICETCAAHLDAAYSFKRKYEDSIVRFVRQTSYNEESEAMITCENSRTSKMCYQRDCQSKQLMIETMRLNYLTEYDLTTDEDNDGQVLTKLISLDNRPPNDAERLNSDDNRKDRCHDLAGYYNIWDENDVNLTQKYSSNGSVHEALEGSETVQNIYSAYQESNLLPVFINHERDDDVPFQCEIDQQDFHNQVQDAHHPHDMFNSHERNSNLLPSNINPHDINNEDEELSRPSDVYNNQERDDESSHSSIYQQDINNEDEDSNILSDDVIPNPDDGMLSLENTNSCCTESTNKPYIIDNENGLQDELMEYLKLKRSETAFLNDEVADSLTPEILSKVYHYGYGMKPFKCDVCCRWFKTEGHIRAHMFHHYVDEKKIKCRKCRLTFLTEPHFRNHRCVSPI